MPQIKGSQTPGAASLATKLPFLSHDPIKAAAKSPSAMSSNHIFVQNHHAKKTSPNSPKQQENSWKNMIKDGNKSSTSLDKKSPKKESPAKLKNSLAHKFKRAMPNNEDTEFWE